jgi:hypothetical protein
LGFVVDEVALGQDFLANSHSTNCYTVIVIVIGVVVIVIVVVIIIIIWGWYSRPTIG